MVLNYIDKSEEGKKRQEIIDSLLPDETIIEGVIYPHLMKRMHSILVKALKQEIEIYKAYPKKTKVVDKPKEESKTFDPRNNKSCFMGKGFRGNDHITDSELKTYRDKIGVIEHPVWGACTLLEIWAADHFEEYTSMVRGVFNYCIGLRQHMPTVKFHVNPLFVNKKTGKFKLTEEQKAYKEEMDELLAKAITFGVRTPAEARRARRR